MIKGQNSGDLDVVRRPLGECAVNRQGCLAMLWGATFLLVLLRAAHGDRTHSFTMFGDRRVVYPFLDPVAPCQRIKRYWRDLVFRTTLILVFCSF